MARSRRISHIRKPRSVDSAKWRNLRRDFGGNAREFDRRARALIHDTNRAIREQAREAARRAKADERARIKETRAALRFLRKAKLFEPPRSAYRVIQTKGGPRRLLKGSYLTRSPKLKAAISEHQSDVRLALRQRLLRLWPAAGGSPDPFDFIRTADPAYIAQLNSLSDDDFQALIRTKDAIDYHDMVAEMLGQEPAEYTSRHPLHYHRKRTIIGVRI